MACHRRYNFRMPSARRFPPPRNVEETEACFLVRDANGQALGYFYLRAQSALGGQAAHAVSGHR
jgi:hypothetical protein